MEENVDTSVINSKIVIANYIAITLKIVATFLIIIGLICGLVFANVPDNSSLTSTTVFAWSIALTWWIGCGVLGLILIGISEIINLLELISRK